MGHGYVLYVFPLVLVRHFNVGAVWLEVNRDCLAKPLVVRRKCQIEHVVNVIIPGQ